MACAVHHLACRGYTGNGASVYISMYGGRGVEYRANENITPAARGKRDTVHCKDNSLHSLTQEADTVRPQLHGHGHDGTKHKQPQRPPPWFL